MRHFFRVLRHLREVGDFVWAFLCRPLWFLLFAFGRLLVRLHRETRLYLLLPAFVAVPLILGGAVILGYEFEGIISGVMLPALLAIACFLEALVYFAFTRRRIALWASIPLLAAGGYFVTGWMKADKPTKLSSDRLTVAIADFHAAEGRSLGRRAARDLETELEYLSDNQIEIKTRRLFEIPIVADKSRAGAKSAMKLARGSRGLAHGVIWGEAQMDGDTLRILPRIAVAESGNKENVFPGEGAFAFQPELIQFDTWVSLADAGHFLAGLAYAKQRQWDGAVASFDSVPNLTGRLYSAMSLYSRAFRSATPRYDFEAASDEFDAILAGDRASTPPAIVFAAEACKTLVMEASAKWLPDAEALSLLQVCEFRYREILKTPEITELQKAQAQGRAALVRFAIASRIPLSRPHAREKNLRLCIDEMNLSLAEFGRIKRPAEVAETSIALSRALFLIAEVISEDQKQAVIVEALTHSAEAVRISKRFSPILAAQANQSYGEQMSVFSNIVPVGRYDLAHSATEVIGGALTILSEEGAYPLYEAEIQDTLSKSIAQFALIAPEDERASILELARVASQSALARFSKGETPWQWARAQAQYGSVLHQLGMQAKSGARVELFLKSAEAYREATQSVSATAEPDFWRQSLEDFADNLRIAALYAKPEAAREISKRAIEAYGDLLSSARREDVQRRAELSNKLGIAYIDLGDKERPEAIEAALRSAVMAFGEVAILADPETDAALLAEAERNKGMALMKLAMNASGGKRIELFTEVISCFNSALLVYDAESHPQEHQVLFDLRARALSEIADAATIPRDAADF